MDYEYNSERADEPQTAAAPDPEDAARIARELEMNEVIENAPKMIPPEKLYGSKLSRLLILASRLDDMMDASGNVDAEASMEMMGEAMDFFESIAVEPRAFAEWAAALSIEKSFSHAAILLAHYTEARTK